MAKIYEKCLQGVFGGFVTVSHRGDYSHAEAQRNFEHAERKVSHRFGFLNAPAAPRPSRGGVAVGRGGVCNSHTEVNILTQRNRVTRGFYLTQRRGGIWRFRRIFSESMSFSEFWESLRVWGVSDRRSLSVPSVFLFAARGRPSVPSVPLCELFSLRAPPPSAPLREKKNSA